MRETIFKEADLHNERGEKREGRLLEVEPMSAAQAKAFAILAQSAPSVEEKLNLMAKALAAIAMALENLPSQTRR